MRKKDEQKAKAIGNGHNTVQGFVFGINLEGSENVVMEGIKAFTHAMAKSGVNLATPATRTALTAGVRKSAGTAVVDQAEEQTEPAPEDAVEESTTVSSEEAVEELQGNGTTKSTAKRVPKTPVVLNDIDFNAGKITLKDFVAQKNPSDTYEKYAVIAVWYKENHNLDEANADRIYTAYKFLDWVPPDNVAQYLRDLKASKKWFDKGSGKGAYKINIIGLNKVAAGFAK